MAKLKYQKYILTDLKLPEDVQARAAEYNKRATRILWLEDFVIEGAPSIICSWYWKATEKEGTPSHTHDFDEVIGFFGSDPQNPHDLCGEVEFWLEDAGRKEAAESLLWAIDEWRLEYGKPMSEPRHPALDIGVPWPPVAERA